MRLQDMLAAQRRPFEAILAVATCRDSLLFLDLCFPPFDIDAAMRRLIEDRDPGVMFETASRVVVIEEHRGQLRYYAGGWCPDNDRLYLEQDRIAAEGHESGVFASVDDAIGFVEKYLVEQQSFEAIEVVRQVR